MGMPYGTACARHHWWSASKHLSPCCAALLCVCWLLRRLWFAIEPEQGDLFLIERTDSSSSSGSWSSGCVAGTGHAGGSPADPSAGNTQCDSASSIRDGLPAWLGADIPVIPAGCSAAEGALSRAHVSMLLELCCSIKVRGIDRSQVSDVTTSTGWWI